MIPALYRIIVLPAAEDDIDNVYDYIAFEKHSLMTAERYVKGIYITIYGLALNGHSYGINYTDSLQRRYGRNVRTAPYKKMSIIYTIMGNFVIVHRVVAGSMII